MSTATTTKLEIVHYADVTIGKTTYKVRALHHEWTDQLRDGRECSAITTFLTGPRGAEYRIVPYINGNGLCRVMSCKSGNPLRVHGNEVRVYQIGDVIELAK